MRPHNAAGSSCTRCARSATGECAAAVATLASSSIPGTVRARCQVQCVHGAWYSACTVPGTVPGTVRRLCAGGSWRAARVSWLALALTLTLALNPNQGGSLWADTSQQRGSMRYSPRGGRCTLTLTLTLTLTPTLTLTLTLLTLTLTLTLSLSLPPTLPLSLTRWASTLGPLLERSLRDEIRASLAELPLPRSLRSVHLVCIRHTNLKPRTSRPRETCYRHA